MSERLFGLAPPPPPPAGRPPGSLAGAFVGAAGQQRSADLAAVARDAAHAARESAAYSRLVRDMQARLDAIPQLAGSPRLMRAAASGTMPIAEFVRFSNQTFAHSFRLMGAGLQNPVLHGLPQPLILCMAGASSSAPWKTEVHNEEETAELAAWKQQHEVWEKEHAEWDAVGLSPEMRELREARRESMRLRAELTDLRQKRRELTLLQGELAELQGALKGGRSVHDVVTALPVLAAHAATNGAAAAVRAPRAAAPKMYLRERASGVRARAIRTSDAPQPVVDPSEDYPARVQIEVRSASLRFLLLSGARMVPPLLPPHRSPGAGHRALSCPRKASPPGRACPWTHSPRQCWRAPLLRGREWGEPRAWRGLLASATLRASVQTSPRRACGSRRTRRGGCGTTSTAPTCESRSPASGGAQGEARGCLARAAAEALPHPLLVALAPLPVEEEGAVAPTAAVAMMGPVTPRQRLSCGLHASRTSLLPKRAMPPPLLLLRQSQRRVATRARPSLTWTLPPSLTRRQCPSPEEEAGTRTTPTLPLQAPPREAPRASLRTETVASKALLHKQKRPGTHLHRTVASRQRQRQVTQ